MQFLKRVKNNYRSLGLRTKLINWLAFKIKPIDKIMELIPHKGKLLDLGCGLGGLSYLSAWEYPELEVFGIDPLKSRIKLANNVFSKPKNLKFKQGKIEDLAKKDFNAILLIDVIYLVPEEELIKILKLCYEKTIKDGALIIKTMNKDRFFRHFLLSFSSVLITFTVSVIDLFFKKTKDVTNRKIRRALLKYYYSKDLKKILEDIGWKVKTYDIPQFFIYPNIIYYCKK